MIASALIGGGINLLGSFLGSSDAATQNKELMHQQYQYSRDLMKYQNELNSPGTYLQQLKDANLSPALMYSKGANQLSTGLGSTPSGDLSGVVQNKALLAQIANTSADTALKIAEAKKSSSEAKRNEIENKVRDAQSVEEIASAEELHRFMNETFYTEDELKKESDLQRAAFLSDFMEEHPEINVQFEEDTGTPYFVDSNGYKNWLVNAVNMFGYNRRRRVLNRSFDGEEVNYVTQKINQKYLELQQRIYEKYGEKVESAKLQQAMAYVRNAVVDADLKSLDYKVFEKLGLGPNVIRSILSGAQALSGDFGMLMNGVGMMLK